MGLLAPTATQQREAQACWCACAKATQAADQPAACGGGDRVAKLSVRHATWRRSICTRRRRRVGLLFVEIRKLRFAGPAALPGGASLVAGLLMLILGRPNLDWKEVLEESRASGPASCCPDHRRAQRLLTQIEHGPRAWDHMLALPVPRWRLFATKGIVLVGLIAVSRCWRWDPGPSASSGPVARWGSRPAVPARPGAGVRRGCGAPRSS